MNRRSHSSTVTSSQESEPKGSRSHDGKHDCMGGEGRGRGGTAKKDNGIKDGLTELEWTAS